MKRTSGKLIVIGGGAAGFFTAVNAARLNPGISVTILEKSREFLSKVKVSGGGRCNVTHHCFEPEPLSRFYPRGEKTLRWSFEQFQPKDTADWFEKRGVPLKTETDGRMFPVTDSSQTIIDCLVNEAKKYGVILRTRTRVDKIEISGDSSFKLSVHKNKPILCNRVVIATGGYNRENAYEWLRQLGHSIRSPVPSLFTFNFRNKIFSDLAGISVEHARVQIAGTSHAETGPVLFTHWGLSGPAVLKLSSLAARELHHLQYRYEVSVNWLHPFNEEQIRNELAGLRESNSRKQILKQNRLPLPARLWERFVELANVPPDKRWADLSNREIHALIRQLAHSRYEIQGKTTWKEEFVTCGGIPLNEVNPDTLESKKVPGLYFAGEVLDIDGVTGGFNFQAAWTNGWLAAQAIADNTA